MQSRPGDLSDAAVAAAVSDGWELPRATAVYQPVGYGSHHWSIEDAMGGRWFASVDRLDGTDPEASFGRLAAALAAAANARDAGLSFVVAPVHTAGGSILHRLSGQYALALYPYVAGRSGGFYDALTPAEAAELTGMLGELHGVPPPAGTGRSRGGLGVETFALPGRDRLEGALADLLEADGWSGPYGAGLRALLAGHADDVNSALREHDRLKAAAGPQTGRLVLTHGEPHPGNLIRTGDGLVLIDWDTALLAPPERDVWLLTTRTDARAADEYAARSGRSLQPELLTLYELAWALADLAEFLESLRYTPERTADTACSWDALQRTVAGLASVPARCG